ncbi:aspartate/glutamate racemase family protein [Nocardioides maradonensis]
MRLLVLNPNATPAITRLIDAQAREVAHPTTELVSDQPRWGSPSIETNIDGHVATLAMLDLLAETRAYDGVLVSAFSDPGIDALREALDVPVAGIGASGVAAAAEFGDFAVLTVARSSVGLVHRMIADNALTGSCVAVHAAAVSVLDATDPAKVRAEMVARAHELVRTARPAAICIGGGPLGVHADAVADAIGLPVVNAVHAGIRSLERLVATKPHGNRSSAYALVGRKPFVGDQPILDALNQLIWPPTA